MIFKKTSLYAIACAVSIGSIFTSCSSDDDTSDVSGVTQLNVISRNVYLGADIGRFASINPSDPNALVATTTEFFGIVRATDFNTRAQGLAQEIASLNPDVVGLQEMTLFRTQNVSDFSQVPVPNAQDVQFDFIKILQDALNALNLNYTVAAKNRNTDIEFPILLDPTDPSSLGDGRMTMFDVILVKDGIPFSNAKERNYLTFASLSGINVRRGYSSVDITIGGQNTTIVNTHLESITPEARMGQTQELLNFVNNSDHVIITGDFNSDGITNEPTYQTMIQAGFTDSHNGSTEATSFVDEFLQTANFTRRIDFVFHKGNLTATNSSVFGNTTTGPWASDHAGVFATISRP